MVADLDEQSPAGPMYGESLLNALSVYLLRRYAVWPVTPSVYKGGLPRHRLNRVLEYIHENLDRQLSLPQLAMVVGMSPHYFAQLFKQSTGHSPHRYLLLQRLERAKQQLRDREYSIIEVAQNTGFENPSHFARIFRHFEGTTPSRFRADSGALRAKSA
jgi:AraC family transcriptional regulator